MDLSDIPVGEIVSKNMNIEPMNNSIKVRAEMLASQLNPKAAEEVISETQGLKWMITGEGASIKFSIAEVKMPFVDQLANGPIIPVAGGDNGIAHNPDGSTYQSAVPERFYGNPLESLALPKSDLVNEIGQTGKLFAEDAFVNAAAASEGEINNIVGPRCMEELLKALKGGS